MLKKIKNWLLPYAAPFIYYKRYTELKKEIDNCFKNDIKVYCFFPAYHTGGAEKVHTQILKALQPEKVACLITHKSRNTSLKAQFVSNSFCFVDIGATGNYKIFRQKLVRLIAKKLNSIDKSCTVFGCNAIVYYELLPLIRNDRIRKVDLLHAFSPYANGIENFSINYVRYLDTRIVINKRTFLDYELQYQSENISNEYLSRIKIISNALDKQCSINAKSFLLPLKCLFVGRNSPEKRFHIYKETAAICNRMNLPIQFSVAGDFEDTSIFEGIQYLGELNEQQLGRIYSTHHILITTSIYEGFPLTIMEAMCNGLVNIAVNVGGISEHISNENGVLIENFPKETVIITDIITQLKNFFQNTGRLQMLSYNSAKYASEQFDFKLFKAKYIATLLNHT